MGISGPVSLAIALAGVVIVLAVAHHRRWLDAIAHRLDPPPHHQQRGRGHCRVVHPSAPSPLPRRDQGDCSLYRWQGGDNDAA